MITFWVYRGDCFYWDPLIEKYYNMPLNKISTDGMVDLSFGMGFNILGRPRDIKVTVYILDKGYKV